MIGRGPRLIYVPGIAALLLPTVTACGPDAPPQAEMGMICQDSQTHFRLPDSECGDFDDDGISHIAGHEYLWYPMGTNTYTYIPPIGSRVVTGPGTTGNGFVPRPPPGATRLGGTPASGGSTNATDPNAIQRGGLGVKAAAGSGSGVKAGTSGSGGSLGKSGGS